MDDLRDGAERSLMRIGPAVVVAAVVLGPGSIVGASRVGCQYGYQLLWVVPLAGMLMMAMTIAAMAIGVLGKETPCQAVASRFGRPAAWLVGGMLMGAVTLFQASNNNALLMALEGFGMDPTFGTDVELDSPAGRALRGGMLLGINLLVIVMLIAGRRDLYRRVERAMAILVAAMVVAFLTNLLAARPSAAGVAGGFIPRLSSGSVAAPAESPAGDGVSWLAVGALIATTFSVAGAFYQAYQVREKGWTGRDLRLGVTDAVVGIGTLAAITAMILITAAAALHGRIAPSELTDAAAVARALEPLFGSWARIVFSIGIMAGAVSSFVVNALVGGVVFSDSLGSGVSLRSRGVRVSTVAALLLGWSVAAVALMSEIDLVSFIIVAQALTVLGFPLLAAVLLWQLHHLPYTGPARLPLWVTPTCYAGFLVVLGLAVRTVWGLAERFLS